MRNDIVDRVSETVDPQVAGSVAFTGLLGSSAVALAGLRVGRSIRGDWLHREPVADLTFLLDRGPAYLLAVAGLALLVGAWLALGPLVSGTRRGTGVATMTAALWSAPFLLVPPLFSDDGWSYAAVGTLARYGLSPYLYPPASLGVAPGVSRRWLDTTSPYGPVAVSWGGVWAHVSVSPWVVLLGYRLLAVLALALLAWTVPRLARAAGRDPAGATWLGVANPLVLVHGIAGVHLDLAMVALVLLALDLAVRRRWVWAAVVAGVAAAVKWPALLVLPGLVLVALPGATRAARVRRFAWTVALSGITLLCAGLLPGTGEGWWYGLTTTPSSLSIVSVLGRLTGARSAVQAVGVVCLVLLMAILVLHGTGTTASGLRMAAAVAVATLAVAPVVHYWYFLWCLPVVAVVVPTGRTRTTVVSLLTVLGLLAPWDPSRHLPGTGLAPCLVAVAITWPWWTAGAGLLRKLRRPTPADPAQSTHARVRRPRDPVSPP